MTFRVFLYEATDNSPYDHHCQLACGSQANPDKPDTLVGGTPCRSQLIDIPTGLGKEIREPASHYGADSTLSAEERALVAELVADGLEIQDKFPPEPLYKKTGKGHYQGRRVEEIRRARQKGKWGKKECNEPDHGTTC